jgi:hypothetical protein
LVVRGADCRIVVHNEDANRRCFRRRT